MSAIHSILLEHCTKDSLRRVEIDSIQTLQRLQMVPNIPLLAIYAHLYIVPKYDAIPHFYHIMYE